MIYFALLRTHDKAVNNWGLEGLNGCRCSPIGRVGKLYLGHFLAGMFKVLLVGDSFYLM